MLAWLRRIIVSVGVGAASYALMLGIMVLSVVYDREFEPVITFAFDTGRGIIDTLDRLVAGTYWGQVAVNHLRERVNMTHVVLSLPAIIIAVIPHRYSLKLDTWGKTHRTPANSDSYHKCTGDGHSWSGAFHLQCPGARNLCGPFAICRLDLAGIIKCA